MTPKRILACTALGIVALTLVGILFYIFISTSTVPAILFGTIIGLALGVVALSAHKRTKE